MSDFNNNLGKELGWDDEIQQDGFELVQDGDYNFIVTSLERGRSNGSERLPACNMAIVEIVIHDTHEELAKIKHYLLLHSKLEWKLSEFFASIGQKKKGEKLKMNWNDVVGAEGKAKVIIDKYTNDKGEVRESNKIMKFYAKNDDTAQAFTPGRF